ncbi:hypothetical protein [Herbiconiux sp. A18JL235]|uniref:Prepilin type IV endopeptidase peptidase domain-containing protein n=1 Tax=Herbiconiux sp. A18JL235 TaxID=3152363 RepID=A0AB39BK09_9MICO
MDDAWPCVLALLPLLHFGAVTLALAPLAPSGVGTVSLLPLLHLGLVTLPLAWADAQALRLPNALTMPGLVVTITVVVVVGDGLAGVSLVGVLAVTALGWRAGWLGLGDVKLLGWMAGASALTGTLDPVRLAAAAAASCALVLAALAGARSGARAGAGVGARRATGPERVAVVHAALARGRGGAGAGAGVGARRATGPERVTVRIPFGPALLAGFWFGVLLPFAR